ncbi:MAG: MBL fold metallo-hydrolase [Burkholderiales bacterium]|nr:MBL fold metallo-hydrolase [Burkholderiales bacterium]
MRPILDARLVNDAFGDPGVYVDFRFEKRALAFDLGDNAALAPRHLLRLTHVFVSHTHMDHFIGFDRLVRICVGRHAGMRLFGPPGFVDQVERRLNSYTWDRVDRYDVELALTVTEVDERGATASARFRTRTGFAREPLPAGIAPGGLLADEGTFRVRCAMLDHRTPCLGFALEEKTHVNVWKNRLEAMGLKVGPWVGELKRAALAGAPGDTPIEARWRDASGQVSRTLALAELEAALEFVPGQRIAYVTDVVFHEANVARIVDLARDADLLFIESVFLDADGAHAAQKQHLTARQAGTIARLAGARNVVPFHFSPRYAEREQEVRAELESAWRG